MKMRHEKELASITPQELAAIGAGHIAYLREISGKEMNDAFPGKLQIDPDVKVWALFGADGTPIMLAGDAGAALQGAFQNDLVPVAIH
jgi:hypothetical protein